MSAIRIVITSALITAAAIKAVPALAEPAAVPAVSVVRTADLDLSSERGRRSLDLRLVRASAEVCGTAADVDLTGSNGVRQCRRDVLSRARAASKEIAAQPNLKGAIAVAAR